MGADPARSPGGAAPESVGRSARVDAVSLRGAEVSECPTGDACGASMLTYLEILRAIRDSEADYVWMGVTAAGVYGSTMSSVDFDFFVRPVPDHLDRVRAAFRRLGMSEFHANVASENLILMEAADSFSDPLGGPSVDLMTHVSGPSFDEIWRDHQVHIFQGIELRVASLEHILASKIAAGREKDVYVVRRLAEELQLDLKELEAKYGQRPPGT